MITGRFIPESHEDSTVESLKRDIEAFKRECRPAGRGRPVRIGARYFYLNGKPGQCGHTVCCTIGEKRVGINWGLSVALTLDNQKASLTEILRALAA